MAKFKSKYLKPFKNFYIIVLVVFVIWMLFFDTHSFLLHRDLNEDIDDLEKEINYYKDGIKKDAKESKTLETKKGVEKVARETYYMKKKNEDIYIIEYEDSIPKQKKDD